MGVMGSATTMPSTIGRDPVATEVIDAASQRAEDWLTARIDEEGRPIGDASVAGHAYRLPYALLLLGRRAEAARVLGWMERDVLDDRGDLADGPMRTGFLHRWASYPLAIITMTAWHLEQYQTATRVMATLRTYQHPECGGALAERPEVRTTERQDIFPTAQLGLTALTFGDRAMADGAFTWFERLYAAQTELPDVLYSATDGAELITDVDGHDRDDREAFGLVTYLQQPRQAFYNPGIAAAFLGRYAAMTGSQVALRLGDAFLALTVDGTPDQFDFTESVQVCKFGWGAAAMLDATGDEKYRGYAERMAAWFVAAQRPDGSWDNSPFLMPEGPADGPRLEVTAEFVQHLAVIQTALAGEHRPETEAAQRPSVSRG